VLVLDELGYLPTLPGFGPALYELPSTIRLGNSQNLQPQPVINLPNRHRPLPPIHRQKIRPPTSSTKWAAVLHDQPHNLTILVQSSIPKQASKIMPKPG
jgi:hypothetical protein